MDMTDESQNRWVALYVLCAGMLMIVLDITIVNVALPSIQDDLGFSQSNLAWVVNAYLVPFGRKFIANPDYPIRVKLGAPLNEIDGMLAYAGDAERGYTDYPPHRASTCSNNRICRSTAHSRGSPCTATRSRPC